MNQGCQQTKNGRLLDGGNQFPRGGEAPPRKIFSNIELVLENCDFDFIILICSLRYLLIIIMRKGTGKFKWPIWRVDVQIYSPGSICKFVVSNSDFATTFPEPWLEVEVKWY